MKWRCTLWFMALLILVLTGCKSDEDLGNVSGQVTLEGESSHEDITVELYARGSDDPIWTIVSNHPCIGFPYSAAAHFDWRMEQPRYETTTNITGDFVFPEVADGVYILCARRTGFGWSSPTTVAVQGGDVALPAISLYPETTFQYQSLLEDTIFAEDHHYVFDGVINIPEGITLTIQPGAVLRFSQDMSMTVEGILIATGTPDKWIVWTSRSDTLVTAHWNMIRFNSTASPPNFSYNRIEGSYQGIVSLTDGGVFDHCFFRKISAVCLNLTGEAPEITNCIFYDIGGLGVEIRNAANVKVESSLFHGNGTFGVLAYEWNIGNIYNNWFEECGTADLEGGLHLLLSSDVRYWHNEINNCNLGIYLGSKCDSTNLIQSNFFTNIYRCIYVGVTEDNRGPSYPSVHFNCFTNVEENCIQITQCPINRHDIETENNYWDTVSETEINDCILDGTDGPGCPFVLFRPFLTACPDSAGVTC